VLIDELGWRNALLALAVLNGLAALLHASVIPGPAAPDPATAVHAPAHGNGNARRVLRQPAFWGFVATAILHGVLFTGFAVHLIPLLVERGLSLDAAVGAFALVGPAQVGARVIVAATERRFSMRAVGLATTLVPVLTFALLWGVRPGPWVVALFAVLYGASNGMMTIVRAVLPIELFGREDYGAIQGMISAPATLSRAAAPFAFGALWALAGGYGLVLGLAVVLSLCSFVFFACLVFPSRRTDPR
jgi:predicted MFS family arabinose efflux permease